MSNKYLSLRRDYYLRLKEELKEFRLYALSNLGVVITLLYFVGSIAGLLYLNILLDSFGVNVFNHIELSDYLLALLSNGQIMIAFSAYLSTMTLIMFFFLKKEIEVKKDTKLNLIISKLSAPLYILPPLFSLIAASIIILFFYSWIMADADTKNIREAKSATYNITLTYPIKLVGTDYAQLNNVNLVTSTNANLFVFDRQLEQLVIVPHANVAALVPLFEREEKVTQVESPALDTQSNLN